nr:XRE family transcriptional regulator [Melissococcus plutonius]
MIGEKMRSLRKNKKMTLDDLATKLNELYPHTINFNKGKLSKWENNKEEPKLSSIRILADYYGISIDDFYNSNIVKNINYIYNQLDENRKTKTYNYAEQQLNEQKQEEQSNVISFNSDANDQLTSFDWCGYVSAGTGEFLDGNERKSIIQLPKSDIPQNADFAVTVNGDSMKPVFKNHEMIFVERTTDLPSGSIGIVIIDGEAFVKKIYIHKDCITLVSLNPTYEDKVIKNAQSIKVIGRVII